MRYNRQMNFNIKCSEFKPEDYRGKRLVWYAGEMKRRLTLSPFVSDDGTRFALIATAVAVTSFGSSESEGHISVAETQIDEGTLRRMKKPDSRFLRPICDYVIFDSSPGAEARFAA